MTIFIRYMNKKENTKTIRNCKRIAVEIQEIVQFDGEDCEILQVGYSTGKDWTLETGICDIEVW